MVASTVAAATGVVIVVAIVVVVAIEATGAAAVVEIAAATGVVNVAVAATVVIEAMIVAATEAEDAVAMRGAISSSLLHALTTTKHGWSDSPCLQHPSAQPNLHWNKVRFLSRYSLRS